MKNDQQDDEVEPPIITLEKTPGQEEQIGSDFISDGKEDEPKPESEQVQARPRQNMCLRSELKNIATSCNQEMTNELECLRDENNSRWSHTIAKTTK